MVKILNNSGWLRNALSCAVMLCILSLGACNSKDEPDNKIDTQVAQNVAVTKFSIQPNAKIMANLDSVYFSIDLEHRVIYNADSLPLGTKIDKLVPLITYPSTVGGAEITMTGGQTRTGTVDYITNPSDSIDFTGDVTLRLTSTEGNIGITYKLKVNVHQCNPDSLMWDKVATSALPSRFGNPKEQRTVATPDKVFTIVRENNDQLTLASCVDPAENNWQKLALSLPFSPNLRSLNAVGNTLFILDTNGSLYESTDEGLNWIAAGPSWLNIIGEFNNTLLGISTLENRPAFDIYPRPQGFEPYTLPDDFPIENLSNFNTFTSKWSASDIGFFSGGSRGDEFLQHTWGYDGLNWAKISDSPLPALNNAVIFPYFSYRKTTTSWIQTEYSVWICLGGTLPDGSINPKVYISYDNGVAWRVASDQIQTPDFVHPGSRADVVIHDIPMNANLNDTWTKAAPLKLAPQMRLSYKVDGDNVDWDCPYIYLFGGVDASGATNDQIRRAVLARLTFTPIF